jgi:hypothetical protein
LNRLSNLRSLAEMAKISEFANRATDRVAGAVRPGDKKPGA